MDEVIYMERAEGERAGDLACVTEMKETLKASCCKALRRANRSSS